MTFICLARRRLMLSRVHIALFLSSDRSRKSSRSVLRLRLPFSLISVSSRRGPLSDLVLQSSLSIGSYMINLRIFTNFSDVGGLESLPSPLSIYDKVKS